MVVARKLIKPESGEVKKVKSARALALVLVCLLVVPVVAFGDIQSGVMILQIGSNKAYIDGDYYELDAEPIIYKNRTMVPLRFIADTFGAEVAWNSKDRTVTIEQKNSALLGAHDGADAIRQSIEKAQEKISISTNRIVESDIYNLLNDSVKKSVIVKVLAGYDHNNLATLRKLQNEGIECKMLCESSMDDFEYIVVDDVVFIGDAGILDERAVDDKEYTIMVGSSSLATDFQKRFDSIWGEISNGCKAGFCEPANLVWKTEWNIYNQIYRMSLTENGVVVVVKKDSHTTPIVTYLFDANTGEELGSLQTINRYYQGFAKGDSVLFGEEYSNNSLKLSRFNPKLNRVVWSYKVDDPISYKRGVSIETNSVVLSWGENLVVGTKGGYEIVDFATGVLRKRVKLPSGGFIPYAIVDDSLIMLHQKDDSLTVVLFDLTAEKILWQRSLAGEFSYSGFGARDDAVIDYSDSNIAFVLEPRSGDRYKLVLLDLSDGDALIEQELFTNYLHILLSDRYLFYTVGEETENNQNIYWIVRYDIDTNRSSSTLTPMLSALLGYENDSILMGMMAELHCYHTYQGIVDFRDFIWRKRFYLETVPNRYNVLFDRENKCYYIAETTLHSNSNGKSGLVKYGCE